VFDALLLLIGDDPGEIDVPSGAPSPLTHAVLLVAVALLAWFGRTERWVCRLESMARPSLPLNSAL
jgi:hypothetical protein